LTAGKTPENRAVAGDPIKRAFPHGSGREGSRVLSCGLSATKVINSPCFVANASNFYSDRNKKVSAGQFCDILKSWSNLRPFNSTSAPGYWGRWMRRSRYLAGAWLN